MLNIAYISNTLYFSLFLIFFYMISIEKGSLTAAFLRCMKFIDILKRAKTCKVPLPNARLTVIDGASADVKLDADF